MHHAIIVSSVLAALALSTPFAAAQTQMQKPATSGQSAQSDGKYCLKSATGASNCIYNTMAACQQARKGGSGQCLPNQSSTTGSGAGTQK